MAQTDESKKALTPDEQREKADALIERRAASAEAGTDAIADYEARFPDDISADARRAQEQEDADLDAAFEEMRQMHLDELELRANSGKLHIPVNTGDGELLEMTEEQIREAAVRDPGLRLESPDGAELAPTDENIAALREYHEQQHRDNEIDYDAAGDPDYLGAQAEAQFNRDEEQQSWEDRQADLLRQQQEAVAAGREAEARGERVIYVHGRPYVDPGNEHEPVADASAATLQRIENSSIDMMMSLVDRMKDDITFVRENIRELPARERGPVTDAFRQVVTEAAAQVEQDQQAERRHEAGSDLEL